MPWVNGTRALCSTMCVELDMQADERLLVPGSAGDGLGMLGLDCNVCVCELEKGAHGR